MPEESKLFVIETPVSEKTREFFEAAAGKNKRLDAVTADALREVANGGILLTRKDVAQIEQSAGVKLRTPAQVQLNIEKTARRKNGCRELSWFPDPVYDGQLDEIAISRGIGVHYILQEAMDWFIDKGWQFEWDPEPVPLKVTPSEASYMRSLMDIDEGTPLRGADVIRFLRETVGDAAEEVEVA